MRLVLALALFSLAACQRSVRVEPPGTPRANVTEAEVRAALGARHFSPDAEIVRSLGPSAAPVLIALAESGAEANATRIRATLALRHQAGDTVKTALRTLALTSELPALRRSAVSSLAHAFGATDPHGVIDVCVTLRAHPDASVRRAAAEAEMRARVLGARAIR